MFIAAQKFPMIGSLREGADGEFFVGPWIHPTNTAHPDEKARGYKRLGREKRGPFTNVRHFHDAMLELALLYVEKQYPPGSTDPDGLKLPGKFKLMRTLADYFGFDMFQDGPFCISHDDMDVQNILVGLFTHNSSHPRKRLRVAHDTA